MKNLPLLVILLLLLFLIMSHRVEGYAAELSDMSTDTEAVSTYGLWYAEFMQISNITRAQFYDIPLSDELQQYTWNVCTYYELQDYYTMFLAMMWQESDYRPGLVSKTNDYGIMQINKSNHKRLKKQLGITDFLDAPQCITAGITMMKEIIIDEEVTDIHTALMCYNMGSTKALRKVKNGTTSTKYSRGVVDKQEQIEALVREEISPTI